MIVCSAHAFMRPEIDELLWKQHYMFLEKPFNFDDLFAAIETQLGSSTRG